MIKNEKIDYITSHSIDMIKRRSTDDFKCHFTKLINNGIIPRYLYKYKHNIDQGLASISNKFLFTPLASEFEDSNDSSLNLDISSYENQIRTDCLENYHIILYFSLLQYYKKEILSLSESKALFRNHGLYSLTENILSKKRLNIPIIKIFERIQNYISTTYIDMTINKIVESLKQSNKQARNFHYVGCLSEDSFSDEIWKTHGNDHRGICIEYDLLKLIDSDDYYVLKFLFPVIYRNIKEFPTVSFINAFFKRMETNREDDNEDLTVQTYKQILTKDPIYSFEKEWRFIIPDKEDHWKGYLPMNCVTKVIIGKNMDVFEEAKINSELSFESLLLIKE